MKVPFEPAVVTGVGSLPFTDVQQAIRFVAQHSPVLPFWPQLPQRHPGEGVIPQGLGRLAELLEPAAKPYCWRLRPGSSDDFLTALEEEPACMVPETAAGFFALEAAILSGQFPQAIAVKAQCEGPITLACCLYVGHRPLVCLSGWLDHLTSFITRQVVWQIRRLQQLGKPVVFVIDEPAISLALEETAWAQASMITSAINRVLQAIRQTGAVAGLHCCAPLPISILQALDLDLISFDAHMPMNWGSWADLTHSIMARGGHLAFGLVPTDPSRPMDASDLFVHWLQLAAVAGDVVELAKRTIVTATCGLGLGTPTHARVVFNRCHEVADRIDQLVKSHCDRLADSNSICLPASASTR